MARTMRAAQYDKELGKVLLNDVPIPEPGNGQLQVKITAASLCHSDLMMNLRPDNLGRAVTIGHEGVGVVSRVHPSAEGKGFRTGDKVGMLGIIDNCFTCDGCQLHPTFCVKGSAKMQGLQVDGVFAEYMIVDWRSAIHLPDTLPIERMSPLFCAGITAFHGVNKCRLNSGQWLAIVGCGGLGQLAIRYAKAMGINVVGLDVSDTMLEKARQNGADATFNPKTNPKFLTELRKLTNSRGCHAAAVFSASNAAYTTGMRALTFNGLLMVVGLPEKPLEFPAFAISLNLLRVKGASNGTASEMKQAVDFTAKHQIIPDVQFRNLHEMPQMWDELAQGKAEKRLVVLFGESKSKI